MLIQNINKCYSLIDNMINSYYLNKCNNITNKVVNTSTILFIL